MTSLSGPLYQRTSTRSFPLIQTAFAVGVFVYGLRLPFRLFAGY